MRKGHISSGRLEYNTDPASSYHVVASASGGRHHEMSDCWAGHYGRLEVPHLGYNAAARYAENRKPAPVTGALRHGSELVKNLARSFRLWGKKRGDRRTGSRLLGSLGEAIFFGVLFVLGATSLSALLTSQAIHPTPEVYQPGFGFWLLILVLGSFALIGGGGVLYTVMHVTASAERRSALAKKASGIDLLRETFPSKQAYPHIPRDTKLTDSPGVVLLYRLPQLDSSAWRLLILAIVNLAFIAFSCVVSVVSARSLLFGSPDWLFLGFASVCVAVSVRTVDLFLRQIWRHSRIGPTCVEISDLPLRPRPRV